MDSMFCILIANHKIDLKNIFYFFFLIAIYGSCTWQEVSHPDLIDWTPVRPETVNVPGDQLSKALSFLSNHCGENGLSQTIVVKDNRVIFQGDSIFTSHNIYSCTKSFTSTIFGLLQEEGKVSLDEPIRRHIPDLSALYPDMTFRHLLTMTSGYNARGINRWNQASEDWSTTPFVQNTPLFEPGSAYAYWDEAMMLLGKALTIIAGEPLDNYLERHVLHPIDFGEWNWWASDTLVDGMRICNGCTGISINAKQLTQFGHLILNQGVFKGDALIPSSWITQATANQVPSSLPIADTDRKTTDGTGKYGFNWWVFMPSDSMPVHAFYASGFNHNVCLIIPDWNMIITRMGDDGNPEAGKHQVYAELIRRLDLKARVCQI